MKKLGYILLPLVIIFLSSCSSNGLKNTPEKELTYRQAEMIFDNSTLEEGAHFYRVNRGKFSFLDSLYFEECFPLLADCSLIQLKNIFLDLRSTPIEEYVYCLYDDMKEDYLDGIAEELDSMATIEVSLFLDDVIPLIDIVLDSLISEDLGKVMEDFSGGFLNVKKLTFFTGGTQARFKEKWEERVDLERYRDVINDFSKDFLDEISSFNSQYYKESTGLRYEEKIQFNTPNLSYNISDNIVKHVSDYVDNEVWGMLGSAFKDYLVPLTIDAVTGGAYTTLYEIGNFAYDVKVTYDEIQDLEPSAEEKLIYICANDIEENLNQHFIEQIKDQMMMTIQNENIRLYNAIATTFSVD